jgi:hypothetical protein
MIDRHFSGCDVRDRALDGLRADAREERDDLDGDDARPDSLPIDGANPKEKVPMVRLPQGVSESRRGDDPGGDRCVAYSLHGRCEFVVAKIGRFPLRPLPDLSHEYFYLDERVSKRIAAGTSEV